MPFLKDKAYREMPYSSETPSYETPQYLSLQQVAAKVAKHQNHWYLCRTIGTITSEFGLITLHEIDDSSVSIRLSLAYLRTPRAMMFLPFTAQLFGSVGWIENYGPVMKVSVMQPLPPELALYYRSLLKSINDTHVAMYREEYKIDE